MIEVYTGTPGSGKSFHAVRRIMQALKKGRHVISNILLNVNSDLLIHIDYIDIFSLLDICNCSPLIVLDECQSVLGSREWHSSDRSIWLRFFMLHRHADIDILLITQDLGMIDKQIRSLIEYEVKHINLQRVKMFRFIFLFSPVFLCKDYSVPTNMRLSSDFLFFKKSIGNLYNTRQFINGSNFKDWCLNGSK